MGERVDVQCVPFEEKSSGEKVTESSLGRGIGRERYVWGKKLLRVSQEDNVHKTEKEDLFPYAAFLAKKKAESKKNPGKPQRGKGLVKKILRFGARTY